MYISQNLYDKLIKKQFYKFICGNALYNCFKHNGNEKLEIVDVTNLENVLNKFKIFRYFVDDVDYEIYTLLHHEIHSGDTAFLDIRKPSIIENSTLWLEPCQCSDISIIDSNTQWNVTY